MPDTAPDPLRLPPPRRGEAAFTADVDARIGSHIKAAEQALMATKSDALRAFDLTVAQYAALMALYYVPDQSSAQLARTGAVTPQTMAQVLTKLEQKELLTRVPSKLHGKVLVIALTPAGEDLALRADVHVRRIEQRLVDGFTDAERRRLRDLLDRATALLRGEG